MRKGSPVTAGSKILENFVSPLDATVVTRLEDAGVTILGKTKMDEFNAKGLLLSHESTFQSGAVDSVADGIATYALCNDYTGAVSCEAALRNVCYVHPTYGTVSRYGLIHAVPSMDQIGVVSKTLEDGAHALSIIAGYDPKDGAMLPEGERKSETDFWKLMDAGSLRIGVPANVLANVSDTSDVAEFIEKFEPIDFNLKYFDVYTQVMQILCCAELSNNTTRYDGIKFGYRAEGYRNLHELYTKSRTEAFGIDIKLASIIGAMVLSQDNYLRYYDKSMRIRRLIKESLEFDKYDVIIMPTRCNSNLTLALSALPRLCGLPAITAPYRGGGITLIANKNNEHILFSVLKAVGVV
jgi:aspartyl-tRNA(Asn)/glutamyl-tRNA(Gln) amidotransferase subunit A